MVREWRQRHDRGGTKEETEANGCTTPSYSGIGQKQETLGYLYIHIYTHTHKNT